MNNAELKKEMDRQRRQPPLIVRIGRGVITAAAGVVFVIAAFLWFWSGLMLSWYFIVLNFLLMLLCLWAWTQKGFALKYMGLTIVAILILLPAKGIGERQLQSRFDAMKADVIATGVEGLDPFEKVVLWQTNVVLAGSWAIAGDPWTGASMAMMNLPTKTGSRNLPGFLKPAPGCPPYHEQGPTSGKFHYRTRMDMQMRVPILGLKVTLDSALLNALEGAGWLHAYDVTWGE